MDALDQLIREEQKELEELRSSLHSLQMDVAAKEAKVAALREAAELRPTGKAKRATRGGKPKGAISKPWKDTLAVLYATGRSWPYAEIKGCYDHTNGSDLSIASVRDRVRSFLTTDLMDGTPEEGFHVTDTAAKKFKFPKPEEASGAKTLEASTSEGPHGEGSGFPPSSPEGSTPSGSTHGSDHVSSFDDDLDEDVPF